MIPVYTHMALVLMLGLYIPPPLAEWPPLVEQRLQQRGRLVVRGEGGEVVHQG